MFLHTPDVLGELMGGLWIIPLVWLAGIAVIVAYYRRELVAVWREPVLRHPVLIIESDDWGAGPVGAQAAALSRLADVFTQHRDGTGRHPIMTLALVLAVPDGPAIRRDGRYHRLSLDAPMFAAVRQAIERGRAAGVFTLQLHGLEHYWPDALLTATDPAVRIWLESEQPATTEQLPSHLQSRWVDASVLPSRPLPTDQIDKAVTEEISLYEAIFRERPRVAVPPTFVWNERVEAAWAREGVELVVAPGLRSACRNAEGLPDCDSGPLRNAQNSHGLTYIVRNDYFEPERGHRAERALTALGNKLNEGRPCLLETHRSNFISDPATCEAALTEVDRLFRAVLEQHPTVRFLSTAELGHAMRTNDPDWIDSRTLARMAAWRERVRSLRGFWRLARLTGLSWLVSIFLPRLQTLQGRVP